MELRHLRAFATIAEEGSVRAAARKLGFAQPSVSEQLAQLEEELRTPLFVRSSTGRTMTLTPSGRTLLPLARRVLDDVARITEAAASTERGGPLRLGVPPGIASDLLGRVVEALDRADGTAQVVPRRGVDAVVDVQQGGLELALVRLPCRARGVRVEPLRTEPLGLWLPTDHPLVDRPVISAADLVRTAVAVQDRGAAPELFDEIDGALRRAGGRPRWVELPALAQGVPAGVLVRDLPYLATAEAAPGLPQRTWRPFGRPPLAVTVALVWRNDAPAPVRAAAEAAVAAARVEPRRVVPLPGTHARSEQG
ncbi:MAG TPA: LysR family transcriptional regulator [Motilibacteraceae bacterium]|nr:LysR family transcriptional regulator [Motilibacteraceae bacterium]